MVCHSWDTEEQRFLSLGYDNMTPDEEMFLKFEASERNISNVFDKEINAKFFQVFHVC